MAKEQAKWGRDTMLRWLDYVIRKVESTRREEQGKAEKWEDKDTDRMLLKQLLEKLESSQYI